MLRYFKLFPRFLLQSKPGPPYGLPMSESLQSMADFNYAAKSALTLSRSLTLKGYSHVSCSETMSEFSHSFPT